MGVPSSIRRLTRSRVSSARASASTTPWPRKKTINPWRSLSYRSAARCSSGSRARSNPSRALRVRAQRTRRVGAENAVTALSSSPVPLQLESGPVVGVAPLHARAGGELRLAKGGGPGPAGDQRLPIELLHERGRGPVVHAPKRGDHARSAGIHESPDEPDQPLPAHVLAESRAAAAQDHQLGGQAQAVDVGETQEPVARVPLGVEARED